MNLDCSAYGKNSLRKKNNEQRQLTTIFFPNKWNFFYFFNMLKDCKQFIFACIQKIDHSWIIKLLVELSKLNKKIYIIMNCKEQQKSDPAFQAVICELLIESQFRIKITVNANKYEVLPTNFCIIDGKALITSSADWTIQSFIKHEWMMIDKNYDNIVEMIEVFEMLWIQYQFVTFENEDIALISSDEPQFERVFQNCCESNKQRNE